MKIKTIKNTSTLLLFLMTGIFLWSTESIGQDETKIMLLGDSITEGLIGSDPAGGFRDDLASMLDFVGANYDLVGTLSHGSGFDSDHEGHGGYRVEMILAYIDSFLVENDPEIVLIHLGTNDVSSGQHPSGIITEIDSLLQVIYDYRYSMIVHISAIIPRTDYKDSFTTQLNQEISDRVDAWRISGAAIKLVDHNTTFKNNPNWENDYMVDYLHPNDTGYALMGQTYFDSLITEDVMDVVPPAAVSDMSVQETGSRTALLSWTATGDDSTVGVAENYDVRYSTELITEGNFDSAARAIGEPDPLPGGSWEEFSVGGLNPDTSYYFAVKVMDDRGNESSISNVTSALTTSYQVLEDDFERSQLGSDWIAAPEFILNTGELSNESLEERWNFMGAYIPAINVEYISLRWGDNADTEGIDQGGLALMMDSPSLSANGYLLFRNFEFNKYELHTIENGAPGSHLSSSPESTLPFPGAGDEFGVALSTDQNGHHFDCYINGVFDTRVSDYSMSYGNQDTLWCGTMLHGNRNNNLEEYVVTGPDLNRAPASFDLISPGNEDTVSTTMPQLVWESSYDPDPWDTVTYNLYYDDNPGFDSPIVIRGIDDTSFFTPALRDSLTYYWKVEATDVEGLFTFSNDVFSFVVLTLTGIEDGNGGTAHGTLPRVFSLSQNYPNPFNPATSIDYAIPTSGSRSLVDEQQAVHVFLTIYDLRGRVIKILVNEPKAPGNYSVHWDGRNQQGERATSGIYFYHIKAGKFHSMKKMVVLK
jgi:lysophospholipase L1-like esterase